MKTSCLRIDPGLDLLSLHELSPLRYPYLLESAASGTAEGRYDILFALPQYCMWMDADSHLHGAPAGSKGFLDGLDKLWRDDRDDAGELPFSSGWFVYLGYELAAEIEPRLRLRPPRGWPVAFATRAGAAIVRDHALGTLTLVSDTPDRSFPAIAADIDRIGDRKDDRTMAFTPVCEEPPDTFIEAVAAAQRHIRAGNLFQANLSREWHTDICGTLSDTRLYRHLRRVNPGPFAGLARWRNNAIISSSPERLLRVRNGRADTRPIAGTRPRGDSTTSDLAVTRELIGHPKERAEHIMLIDLERNDLGRVCAAGTVEVDEYMILESYAHVHHIVSNVTGRLRDDVSPGQAIAAVFPGGTITGCPKVRCMEIIGELESSPRGAYTGSIGYLDRSGDLDLNILIRTLVRSERRISLRAGAGIVADSVPDMELAETRAKARGLLLALETEAP